MILVSRYEFIPKQKPNIRILGKNPTITENDLRYLFGDDLIAWQNEGNLVQFSLLSRNQGCTAIHSLTTST